MLLWERYWRIDCLPSLGHQKRDISVSLFIAIFLGVPFYHIHTEIELPEGMPYKAGDYLAM